MAEITPEQREAAMRALRESAGSTQLLWPFEALDALIALGWGPGAEAEARGYRAGVEDAAKLIEGNHVLFGDRPELRPRTDGDRNGLEYAAAIRALTPGAS